MLILGKAGCFRSGKRVASCPIIKHGPKRRARKNVLKNQPGIEGRPRNPHVRIQVPPPLQPAVPPDQKLQPGYSNRKWAVSGKSLAVIRLWSIRMLGFTLCATRFDEAGEHTGAFTLQYIAGHDTIKTTMRFVHPRAESVSRAS